MGSLPKIGVALVTEDVTNVNKLSLAYTDSALLDSRYLTLVDMLPDAGTGYGLRTNHVVNEAVLYGDCLQWDFSSERYIKADASAVASMPVMGFALEAKSTGELCNILMHGTICNSGWTLSSGFIYASTTAGEITQTPPSGSGDQVQVLGKALNSTTILFTPNFALVQVA